MPCTTGNAELTGLTGLADLPRVGGKVVVTPGTLYSVIGVDAIEPMYGKVTGATPVFKIGGVGTNDRVVVGCKVVAVGGAVITGRLMGCTGKVTGGGAMDLDTTEVVGGITAP